MIRKKRGIILFVIIIITIYSGLYLQKIIRYSYYDTMHQFGGEDKYILNKYYERNGEFPSTEEDLRNFIVNNKDLFAGNIMAEYLTKYDFHLKYDEKNNRYVVYENGPNYRDDNLEVISNSSNTNIFNFLFIDGDVLLFYYKGFPQKEIIIDEGMELPKNVNIVSDSI